VRERFRQNFDALMYPLMPIVAGTLSLVFAVGAPGPVAPILWRIVYEDDVTPSITGWRELRLRESALRDEKPL
jgi:hypothetical protein